MVGSELEALQGGGGGVGRKCGGQGRGRGSRYAFLDCMTPIMGQEEGRQDPRTPPGWGRGAGQSLRDQQQWSKPKGQGCRGAEGISAATTPACCLGIPSVLMSPWRQGRGQR